MTPFGREEDATVASSAVRMDATVASSAVRMDVLAPPQRALPATTLANRAGCLRSSADDGAHRLLTSFPRATFVQ